MARKPPPKHDTINISASHILSPKNFLIWRIIITVYFWTVLIWVIIADSQHFGKIFIYLTIQTLISCVIFMTLAVISSYLHYRYVDNIEKCNRYCNYTEKVQVIATTMSGMLVFVYIIFHINI